MGAYESLLDRAQKKAVEVTKDAESWKRFLESAAYTYQNSFLNQLLIYDQRPEARAVAPMKYWNDKAHFWVRRGAKGIWVIKYGGAQATARVMFDLSDTSPHGYEAAAMPWTVTDNSREAIVKKLNRYADPGRISDCLSEDAAVMAAQYKEMAENVVAQAAAGSLLHSFDRESVVMGIQRLAAQSAIYMAYVRLGLPVENLRFSSFDNIYIFSTVEIATAVGYISQQTSKQLLQQIGAVARSVGSVVKCPGLEDNIPVPQIKTKKEADRNEVYEHRGLHDSQLGTDRPAEETAEPIRNDAPELSETDEPHSGGTADDERNSVQQPVEAGTGNRGTDQPDHEAAGRETARPGEEIESAGLDAVDERLEAASGGNGTPDALRGVTEETEEPIETESAESPSVFPLPESGLPPFPERLIAPLLCAENSTRPTNGEIIDFFAAHISEEERQGFLEDGYKDVWTEVILDGNTRVGFHAELEGLRLWEGGFLSRPTETILPWGSVSQLIAEYIGTKQLTDAEQQLHNLSMEELTEQPADAFRGDEDIAKGVMEALGLKSLDDQRSGIEEKKPIWRGSGNPKADDGERIPDEDLDKALCTGSGFESGNFRIMHQYQQKPDNKAFAAFLKKEYGIGGRSWTFLDGERGFLDYDGKGIRLTYKSFWEDGYVRKFKWTEVASRIGRLIDEGKYLSEKGMEQYTEWLKEQGYEIEQVEQRPFSVGDVVYLENDHPFMIVEIGRFDIRLNDEDFPLLGRAISKTDFLRLLRDNPKNAGLCFPDEQQQEIPIAEDNSFEPQEPFEYEKINYDAPYNAEPAKGPKGRFADNMAAIELLKRIEQRMERGGAPATSEEQTVLAKYVGWGGLADAFDEHNEGWASEYAQLKNALTEKEYEAARESTLTAFYTPPSVIHPIYRALERFGIKGGNILDPCMGIGNFYGYKPSSFGLNDAKLYGVELDEISGRIAKQLYQKANIQIRGYEDADIPDNFFDLVIGNVPFGDFRANDNNRNRRGFLIHDYFAAKMVDDTRMFGATVLITSSGTMDKQSSEVRRYLAARAELIGAVRLPNTVFKSSAGTKVTTDILFLKKRDRIIDPKDSWLNVGVTENGIPINQYYIDHPEMICGEMVMESGPYGPRSTCQPFEDAEQLDQFGVPMLERQLDEILNHLDAEIPAATIELDEEEQGEEEILIDALPNVRNFSHCLVDDKIYFRENSKMREVHPGKTAEQRIRQLIKLENVVNQLIKAQMDDKPDAIITSLQQELNERYDAYHKKYGLINGRGSAMAFGKDSNYFLLCSLEDLDEQGQFKGKTDIFTKRTIGAAKIPDHVDTALEALQICISVRAGVDLDYMSHLCGKTHAELITNLKGAIFLDPLNKNPDGTDRYLTADEYLSGDVRAKLAFARNAAFSDSRLQTNVEALEKVQPKDLDASEITVKLGTTWIPPEDIKQFLDEIVDASSIARNYVQVAYSSYTGTWGISHKAMASGNVRATVKYGTPRINFYQIAEASLNQKSVEIFDTVEEDGKQRRVRNVKATDEAQEKQRQIESEFKSWIWQDVDRRMRLVRLYNDKFNCIRNRHYDGSHLFFPGLNPNFKLRPHQLDAIARILLGPNVLLGHDVGGGKTAIMICAAMLGKMLGLWSKTLIVVPNHLIEQMASEAMMLFPNAKVLASREVDFQKKNRKKFSGRIATGDYDLVIIGHSQLERIPLSLERQKQFLKDEIDEILAQEEEMKWQNEEHFSVKEMARRRKQLEARLERLTDVKQDDTVTFEQLGVDNLMVDEAHNFKNLAVLSKMRNVGGISAAESQKATDLYLKCMYMDELTGGRGITFATGTPISNSMVEMFNMMRYLQSDLLKQMGLSSFDAWASTFAESVTTLELKPEGSGYRLKTRLARFHNIPELMSLFKECADIQTADMLNLPVPPLSNGGKPIVVLTKPTEIQKQMVEALGERADAIRTSNIDPSKDNFLKITTDGRKLALDQRILNPNLPDDPNSKVNACVQRVFEIWRDTAEQRYTQMIFSDLSTPGGKSAPMETVQKEDGSFEVVPGQFQNVYEDIRNKLIALGVPPEEVQFIHSAKTEAQKEEMFAKMRSGKVRILLGSTSRMGAGTNAQRLLVALHHLDVPWRPADIQQREGRMIRQGNLCKEVSVYRYVTEATFDSYSWGLIENKQRFISQVYTSRSPVRSCEDVDELTLSYAELKALTAGNPKIKEKMDLEIQVSRLITLKAAFDKQYYHLQNQVTTALPAAIAEMQKSIVDCQNDIATIDANSSFNSDGKLTFRMTVQGKEYIKMEDAGKALMVLEKAAASTADGMEVGQYRGMKLVLRFQPKSQSFVVDLVGHTKRVTDLSNDPVGNCIRINNRVNAIMEEYEKAKIGVVELEKQLESAKAELSVPWPNEQELKDKEARLAQLNRELKLDERTPTQYADEEEQDIQERKEPEYDEPEL